MQKLANNLDFFLKEHIIIKKGGLYMLLEFKCKNFRSFKDELCFSMEPNSRQKGLDYSIQTTDIGGDHYKSLCSAVIYGPNAAGKQILSPQWIH